METFKDLLPLYPQVLYSATAFVAGGALIYKLANRKKPLNVTVNCWFCNQDTVVPYGNRNCWDCPSCDQYNGFQDNGDYNKPIPAQYTEDLNHGVFGSIPTQVTLGTMQWVNSKMLICRKCNHNQSTKIKLLASFIPKDDGNYDEEIDAYKCHLEEHYKLCRPCQAAVDYYIKYQNRQLRTVLLCNHLRRTQESLKGIIKGSLSASCPLAVVLLRCLSFLICAFLLAMPYSADRQPSSNGQSPLQPGAHNVSAADSDSEGGARVWQSLLELLPDTLVEYAELSWLFGQANQMAVVCVGLSSCLLGLLLAGAGRLRRIDIVSLVLWFLVLCWHLLAAYVEGDSSSWTAAHVTTVLCCLVSFAAAVATRNPLNQRRGRYRRNLTDSSMRSLSNQPALLTTQMIRSFIPSPPPNISKLINHQKTPPKPKGSLSSLPCRLKNALCLGTVSTFTRTDSGYLFSGSRPASVYKDSPPSDYFSMKSCSRPSSPGLSPTPSVDGFSTSSAGSDRQTRPLISPARLNLGSPKQKLYSTKAESTFKAPLVSSSHVLHADQASVYSGRISPDIALFPSQSDLTYLHEDDSGVKEKASSSSGSLSSLVDTTTALPENSSSSQNTTRRVWMVLLLISLSTNLLFATLWMSYNWKLPVDACSWSMRLALFA
ncbi:transmembrane protein 201 isoform X1 [Phycodurus eques]|uniref:transmembrane protein 201 isoform X1 n=1 Tax=Phycodurus eques TaxID=693459 RepID=UPI002ACD86CB|nr:transmembrane protein 201 isoform X1 [Phycodurus eques]